LYSDNNFNGFQDCGGTFGMRPGALDIPNAGLVGEKGPIESAAGGDGWNSAARQQKGRSDGAAA